MKTIIKPSIIFGLVCVISAIVYFFTPTYLVGRVLFQVPVLLALPFAFLMYYRLKPSDIGFSVKEWKKILLYTSILILLAIPGMLYASGLPEFQNYYPKFDALTATDFIFAELLLLFYFFAFELFYRGFALFQLRKHVGDNWAILLQNIPYFLIHIGKPGPELYYSFIAGIVFAYVCIRAKSFLPAFGAHYTTSVIFDYLCWF